MILSLWMIQTHTGRHTNRHSSSIPPRWNLSLKKTPLRKWEPPPFWPLFQNNKWNLGYLHHSWRSASNKSTERLPTSKQPKEWLLHTTKKKDTGEEFKTFDLVDINRDLWYGVPIFTFWRNQVDKGAMPEPDMSSNYIGLYKTHKDTFQIMLTSNQSSWHPKKKQQ